MSRGSWLCVFLAVLTAAAVLWVFGLDWLTALVAALILLSCPIVLALALRESRRAERDIDQLHSRSDHG
jgi:hypothetical protein